MPTPIVESSAVYALNMKQSYNITFHNAEGIVGTLDFNGPQMVFTGKAEESAKIFLDFVAASFRGRIEEAEQKGRNSVQGDS